LVDRLTLGIRLFCHVKKKDLWELWKTRSVVFQGPVGHAIWACSTGPAASTGPGRHAAASVSRGASGGGWSARRSNSIGDR
jgi:hypothetical protein